MKTMWKGYLKVSLVTVPVRVYNAVDTAETVKLNQIHADCGGHVGVSRYCKKCQAQNPTISKGFEVAKGEYVALEDSELTALALPSAHTIDVQGFVKDLPRSFHESPYFLGPDGLVAFENYAIVRESLRKTRQFAIAKVTIRGREDAVALSVSDDNVIVLYKLRYPTELRSNAEVPDIEKTVLNGNHKDAVSMMSQLIEGMTVESVASLGLVDQYATALRELITRKLAGQSPIAPTVPPAQPDIMDALKASIAASPKLRLVNGKKRRKAA